MAFGALLARDVSALDRGAFALSGLVAALGTAVLLQGAFYDAQLILVVGVAAAGALLAGVVSLPAPLVPGFLVLGGGLVTSAVATGVPAEAFKPAATLVLAAACCALAARAVKRDGVEAVMDAVVLVAAMVAVVGLVGLVGGIETWALHADTWRLTSTLTYQNAAGALLAVALAPAIVRSRRSPISGVSLVAITAALVGTLSRGALLGALAAVVVVAIASPRAMRSAAALLPACICASAALVPALIGGRAAWVVAVIGFGAAAFLVVRPPPPAVRAVIVAAVAVALLWAGATTAIRDRFTFSTTDRARVWAATLDRLDEHLLFGTGPGTYELIAPAGGRLVRTSHAHNEYLQVASETGLIGFGTVLAGIAIFARAALRARPRHERARAMWAAGIAGCAALLVHAATDFVWRVPAVIAVAFVLLACLTAEVTTEEPG